MTETRGNLDQTNRNIPNPENLSGIPDVQRQTQAGVENLRESTINQSISNIESLTNSRSLQIGLKYERNINTLTGFLSSIDQLLQEIENIKSGISKKGKDKATKNAIKSSESALNAYAKQLKDKKKALLKQKGSITIYDGDIKNLQEIRGKVEKIKEQLATKGQRNEQRVPEQPYNSLGNAKKSNKRQIDMIRFNQQYQEEVRQGAISRIFNGNIQDASDFYRRIAEGQYTQADYELYIRNTGTLTPSLQKCGISAPLLMPSQAPITGGVHIEQGNTPSNYSNLDWGETFQQGGIAGCLDKALGSFTNMTPGQKDTWKSLTVLGGVAAGIFGLYKFYTAKKIKWRGKAGITAAAIFGSQAITGEGPISLFNKLLTGGFSQRELERRYGSNFGAAVNGLGNSGIESTNTSAPAMYSMMIFNPGTTVSDIQTMTAQFKTDSNSRRTFRGEAIRKLQNKYGARSSENFSNTFSDNFDEKKWETWLASFGVTSSSNNRQNVYELANNAIMNKVVIEKFLTDNNMKITSDSVKQAEFETYLRSKNERNQSISVTDLQAHINDWFIRESAGADSSSGTSQNLPTVTPVSNPTTPISSSEIPVSNQEALLGSQIDQAINNGLDRIYSYFEPKIKKINKVPIMKDIKKRDIAVRFPEVTKSVKSEFVKIENNSATINIDETKVGNVCDDFLRKLRGPSSTVPNYVKNAISKKSRDSLKAELNDYKNKNRTKYNNMKENFMVIFSNILGPIDSTLRNQNISPNIICNGQPFNNINDAINSISIFQ